MTITLKLLQKYHNKTTPETGVNMKYDIKALRNDPAKLEKWYKQRYANTTGKKKNKNGKQSEEK